MKNKQIRFLCVFFISSLLSGCAKYKVQHVYQKEGVHYVFEGRQKAIDLTVRAFDHEDFKGYLAGYQPLAFHIKNKTNRTQQLVINELSLPVASLKNLKKKEPKLFFVNFIPSILVACLGLIFWWEFIVPGVVVLGSCGAQLSLGQYERAVKLLKKRCSFSGDILTVAPYSSLDTLVFVKQADYKPRFTVTLKEPETGTISNFNIFITARTVNGYAVK